MHSRIYKLLFLHNNIPVLFLAVFLFSFFFLSRYSSYDCCSNMLFFFVFVLFWVLGLSVFLQFFVV